MRWRRIIPLASLLLFAAACAHGSIVNDRYVSEDYRFSVALPGPPYEQIPPKDALIALTDPRTGASIMIAANPDPYSDTIDQAKALDYIARDLFFFLTKKVYRVFENTTVDGVQAKHVTLTGTDDKNELTFSAYVVRNYGEVYDIVLWCEPQYFDEASATFRGMVDTFTFRREAGR
jgi:hypothetical protein